MPQISTEAASKITTTTQGTVNFTRTAFILFVFLFVATSLVGIRAATIRSAQSKQRFIELEVNRGLDSRANSSTPGHIQADQVPLDGSAERPEGLYENFKGSSRPQFSKDDSMRFGVER